MEGLSKKEKGLMDNSVVITGGRGVSIRGLVVMGRKYNKDKKRVF